MMTQSDFTASLEQELRLQGLPFSRADLQEFVADAWPLILEDPDVMTWAREFLASDRQAASV
jgi:hypothetical protein